MKIHKYRLSVKDHQRISLPSQSEILSVINQHDEIMLYANVDENKEAVDIDIYIHGTGYETDKSADLFLGTVGLCDNNLILHVFADSAQFDWYDMHPTKRLR